MTKNAKASPADTPGPSGTASHAAQIGGHGAASLPAVEVDTYNAELRDGDGFIGDRASARAFRAILSDERERAASGDEDPIGDVPSDRISKRKLDKLITEGDPQAAGVVLGTIEEFAQEFAAVIRRFMRLKAWSDTQRIVIGGGLRDSRIGELAVGRAAVLLKGSGHELELRLIRHHPDEAGLIGAVHLAPSWIFSGHSAILAVDIGGSNIRAGIVELNVKKAPDLSKSELLASELWRHADDKPDRTQAVDGLTRMLRDLIKRSEKEGIELAPFIGIGCPGIIRADGSIKKGGQNLPGDWEHKEFNLPALVRAAIPTIDGHEVAVIMHNDAVVQGLSELPFMQDVAHWGVMTMGTGLGNARFSNRSKTA
jgi:predicted NBD/HSP70 family sugar kinase